MQVGGSEGTFFFSDVTILLNYLNRTFIINDQLGWRVRVQDWIIWTFLQRRGATMKSDTDCVIIGII